VLGLKKLIEQILNETKRMADKNKRKVAESRTEVKTYRTDFK
jgi:hypothetical protein